jgi:hypothetical protein
MAIKDVFHVNNKTRFVCFKDPDGTVLELIDFGSGK